MIKRPPFSVALFILILTSFLLTACSGQLPNESWPGLSTDGTKVYVAYGPGVIAYDVASQTPAWNYPDELSPTLPFFAAPSVQGERVILGDFGASGGFFSPSSIVTIYGLQEDLERQTVQTLWSDGDLASDRIVAPPLQVEDQVFVGTADNFILALDAQTGAKQWAFATQQSIWAQPSFHDGVLFVASLDKHLYAIEADSGRERWRTELNGALAAQPVVNGNLVYVAGFDNELHALDINSGNITWEAEAEDWIWAAPALANGVLYFADSRGNVYAVDADSGTRIWKTSVTTAVQTSPVVIGDMVYIASEGDQETELGALIALSTADGQEQWRVTTPAPLYTTPVVVDDSIIVAMQSEEALLRAFSLETGAQEWTFAPPEQ